MTSKSQRLIILFLVHLHYSAIVYNTAYKRAHEEEKKFDFKTFPQLQACLDEMEADCVVMQQASQSPGKMEDVYSIIDSCWKKIKLAKTNMTKHIVQLEEIDDMFGKIMKITKKKVENSTVVVTLDLLENIVLELQQLKKVRGQSNQPIETNKSDIDGNSTSSENEND